MRSRKRDWNSAVREGMTMKVTGQRRKTVWASQSHTAMAAVLGRWTMASFTQLETSAPTPISKRDRTGKR